MKEEGGEQEKEQQEQYAVSTMEDLRFLSDLAMCINVHFYDVRLFVRGGKGE